MFDTTGLEQTWIYGKKGGKERDSEREREREREREWYSPLLANVDKLQWVKFLGKKLYNNSEYLVYSQHKYFKYC